MHHPRARAAILHMLPGYLEDRGVEAQSVFAAGGLAAGDVATDAIVLRAQLCAVLHHAARVLGDPQIGIALGTAARPERLGSTGSALLAGPTLGECLQRHAARMPQMQTHVRLDIVVEKDEAVWRHVLLGGRPDGEWLLYEGATTFTLSVLRDLVGDDFVPSLVRFPHPRRCAPCAYGELFGERVEFGFPGGAEIRFPAALLREPVRQRGNGGSRPAPGHGSVADIAPEAASLARTLRLIIVARLAHDPVTLRGCAAILGLSPRTLQRRLGECGLTFEALLDDLRRERALDAIDGGWGDVTTIALSLGYADASHFLRAFRRWTGTTPAARRAALGRRPAARASA